MCRTFSRTLLSGVIATICAVEAIADDGQAAAQVSVLEETIVTARKREESILKVPVTITAFSGELLDDYAIHDVRGISELTPGLNFSTGPLSSGVLVSMRGIGTGTNNPAVDQSVALVVDGVQFTQGLAFNSAMFDMAQVEVLKGPQALFFGKAAPAGVIAVRTADPADSAEVHFRGGYEFEGEEQQGELIVSGPVSDSLGLRLAAQYSAAEGYFKNETVPANLPGLGSLAAAPVKNRDFPDSEVLLLRGTALWKPSDNLTARLKLNYSEMDVKGTGGEPQYVSCPDGTDSLFNPVNFIGGDDCKLDDKLNFSYMDPSAFPGIYNSGEPFNKTNQNYESLELNYDLDNGLTLTSVTGFYDVDQKSMFNGSVTSEFGTPFVIQGHMERTDFTQELRLTSDYDGAWNFMLGGFYQDGETKYLSRLPFNQTYVLLSPRFDIGPALAYADHDVDAETLSFFGQLLWDITSKLELGVGARWTDESRHHKVKNLLPTLSGGSAEPIPLAQPDIGDRNWSPELSLTWTPTDDLTVYGNVKQAYKSGSFDVGGGVNDGDDTSFDDERIRGGEIGVKTLWLQGAVAFNAASYYYKYHNMQVETPVFDPSGGSVGVRTANAADSNIYGVDADISYAPPQLEGLTISAAVNWNEAEYDEFDHAECWTAQLQSQGCNVDEDQDGIGEAQDLSGEPLLRAPQWMANFGISYEKPVFDDMTLRVGSITSYSDSYSASATNIPAGYQDSYVKTNLSLGLTGRDNRWKFELIGDNLTDEIVYGGCAPRGYKNNLLVGEDQAIAGTGTVNGGPGGNPETACWTERGRSVWVRLTWNFL